MKVVAKYKSSHQILGLAEVFNKVCDTAFWELNKICPFDMCEEQRPQILLIHQSDLTDEIEDACEKYNIAIFDVGQYNGIDILRFKGQTTEKFKCDVSYFHTSDIKENTVEEAMRLYQKGFRIKIFGPVPIHSPLYCSHIFPASVGSLLASARVFVGENYLNAYLKGRIGLLGDSSEFTTEEALNMGALEKEGLTKTKLEYLWDNTYFSRAIEIIQSVDEKSNLINNLKELLKIEKTYYE